ncbi:hypothetical protein sos41_35090 [Alphaproteobacteria bacterium SO-S41]|nr:hypothetical protein sos41_35090 [Alphaproteobacteria bacterium SO-S41]
MRYATIAVTAALLAGPAVAKSESAYTKIYTPDAKCKTVEQNDDEGWAVSKCPGYKGIDVWIADGDNRVMVAYGAKGRDEAAMSQTFSFFNVTGETIEWRLKDGKPVATILRWKIDGGEDLPKGEMLAVTQLTPGNQCWIAVVAAHKNKDANELARKAADELAGTVDCANTPAKIVGIPDEAIYAPE